MLLEKVRILSGRGQAITQLTLHTLCHGESLQMLQWKRNDNSCEKRGQLSCERL